MLFNCFSCGKLISLKKDLCPYCMVGLMEKRQAMEDELALKNQKKTWSKKWSIFSIFAR